MRADVQVYDHAVLSVHARRLLVVLAAVAALMLGLVAPAEAANGHIVGTVTGAGAAPLEDVWVDVYDLDDVEYVGGDVTNAQGQYDVALPAGSYLVVFYPDDESYEPELYDDVHDFDIEAATPVVVTDGGSTQADAELTRTASISGHLTKNAADPDFAVQVYDDEGDVVDWGWVEPDGSYEINGLRAGSYQVAFNRLSGFAYSAAEFYDDHAEEGGLAAADPVTLASGEARTDVDAVLVEGGHVTGTLLDSDGQPIRCKLQAFTADRSLVTRSGWSDATTGAFDITGLTTGSYLVRVVNGQACQNGLQYVDVDRGALSPVRTSADPVATTIGADTPLTPTLVYDLGPQVVNTVPPTISGTPSVNTVLTASRGTWSPSSNLTYRYQWLANGTEIPAATRRTYRVSTSDVGKALAVRVTVTRGPSRTASATSALTAVVQAAATPALPAIVNLESPSIMEPARVRLEILAFAGRWSVPNATFRYVWSSGSKVWKDSADRRFTAPEAAYKLPLTLTVVASRPGYADGVVSVSAGSVGKGVWRNTKPPQLNGRAAVGGTLVVTPGKYSPKPTRVTYSWRRDGKIIARAKGASYTLTRDDVGHRIQVRVLVRRKHYQPETFGTRSLGPIAR